MNLKRIICISMISVMVISPNTVQAVEDYNNLENTQIDNTYSIAENLGEFNQYKRVGYNELEEIDEDEISEDEMDEIPLYDVNHQKINTFMQYNSLQNEISYSSSRGRDSLAELENGENMQKAYDEVEEYFQKIHNNDIKIAPTSKKDKYVLDSLSLVSYTLTKDQLKKIFLTIRYDHPELFWIGSGYSYTVIKSTGKVSKVSFYIQSNFINNNYIKIEKQQIEKAVAEYLDMADYYSDEYDIEKVFHDKLIKETVYDPNVNNSNVNLNSHNVAGVLVDHVGVCESYAKTMQMLLNAEKIENVYVTGTGYGGSHAWNQVKIHGEYYNLDVTWDDMDTIENGGVLYNYFNVRDEQFNSAHKANNPDALVGTKEYLYNIERCSSDEYTWKNQHLDQILSVEDCNYEKIKEYIIGQINKSMDDSTSLISMKGEDYHTAKAIYDYINAKFDEVVNDDKLSEDFLARYTPESSCTPLSEGNTQFYLIVNRKYPISSESIEMPDKLTVYFINNSKYLNPEILPENTTDSLQWTSSNSNVAIVDSSKGTIVPLSTGETIITAKIGNLSKECIVTVKDSSYLVDKDNLENLYNESLDRNEDNYISTTWSVFKDALDNAKFILDSDNVTQNQVDEAEASLKEAADNLIETGDKKELQKLYDDNKDKQASSYTEDSWTGFSSAMNEAELVLNNRDALQEDVDNAKVALETSIDNLIELGDTTSLQELYDSNKYKKEYKYTSETWDDFKEALDNAESLLAEDIILKSACDSAYDKLNNAISNLKEAPRRHTHSSAEEPDDKDIDEEGEELLASNDNTLKDGSALADKIKRGWIKSLDNKWYFYDEKGLIKTGWMKDTNNLWYHFGDSGIMDTDWFKDVDGNWYYLNENGDMKIGWHYDKDTNWYHLSGNGQMEIGWFRDYDGEWYYLGESGAMKTGWFKDSDGKWYYLNTDGSMAVDTFVNGYKLGSNGAWIIY